MKADPVWQFCYNAIEKGPASLEDPMQSMMLEFIEGKGRLKEIQTAKFATLGVSRPSTTKKIELEVVDELRFKELEREERKIEKRQQSIIDHFGKVSKMIEDACADTKCPTLTLYGLQEYRTQQQNTVATMQSRLRQLLVKLMTRPRGTLQSGQEHPDYKAFKGEVDEKTSQANPLIEKLNGHIEKIQKAIA